MLTIVSCIHRIIRTTYERRGSKNVVLIMPWMASGGMHEPEVQSKLDVLGAPPATASEAAVQVEYQLNLARQIRKMATRINCQF